MNTTDTIAEAIARSISHNEIVHITIEGGGDIFDAMSGVAGIEDWDTVRENDGSHDVWGDTEDGEEFRIKLTIAD